MEPRLSDQERSKLIEVLNTDAKKYQQAMPDVEIGALCSGTFLTKRGYHPVGQERLYKKERVKEKEKYYLFKAVHEVMDETVTAVPIHPIYELELID